MTRCTRCNHTRLEHEIGTPVWLPQNGMIYIACPEFVAAVHPLVRLLEWLVRR